MRPAKIGQLTSIENRSQPIDRSDSLNAGVLAVPSAQLAWLCGRDTRVGFGDVSECCDQSTDKDGAVVRTKCQSDVISCDIHSSARRSSSPMTVQEVTNLTNDHHVSEIPKAEGNSTGYWISNNISLISLYNNSHLSDIDSHTREEETSNNGNISKTGDQYKNDITENSNLGHSSSEVKSENEAKKRNLCNIKRAIFAGTIRCDEQSSISNIRNTSRHIFDKPHANDPKGLNADDKNCEQNSKLHIPYWHDACKRSFDYTKYQRSLSGEVQPDFGKDMNIKGTVSSFTYANFLNDGDSTSSAEDCQSEVCLCAENKNAQILSVNSVNCHRNRLSHQYLNSSVTGNKLLSEIDNFRCLNTSANAVTCQELDLESNMIFASIQTNETSFIDKRLNLFKPPSPLHHYYNKNSFLKPSINLEQNTFANSNDSKQCERITITNSFITKGNNNHGNKTEQDFDLKCFPQLSQVNCPVHRASPLASPHHQFQHHNQQNLQDVEQQQLLSQCQPRHHDRQYIQQHHHRHCSISSISSLIQYIRCGHLRLHVSPVSLLWTFLSVLVAGTCLLSFLTPYWTIHPDHIHTFGLFNLCIRDQRFSHPRPLCMSFGNRHYVSTSFRIAPSTKNNTSSEVIAFNTGSVDIARIPSGAWQAACLLFGVGVFVQILGALVSLIVLGLKEPWHHRVAIINGYMQTVGVLLLLSGLVLYPVGFSSPFYSYYCDSARAFCTGHCAMGWSYVTAIMATALSIFCPVMSSFAEAHHRTRKSVAIVETATA